MLWHNDFLELLMEDLATKFKEKLLLDNGFHNLSHMEVPQNLVETLKKGEKFPPHLAQPKGTCEHQFRAFIWDFVRWAARVLFHSPIPASKGINDLDFTLEELSRDENDPSHYFWWSIKHQFDLFKSQLHDNHLSSEPCSTDEDEGLIPRILQPGIICTTADKNYGLVILPAEIVRNAASKILNDLGGVIVTDQNEEQIMGKLNLVDANLRKGYMSGLLAGFPAISRSRQCMAVLKLNPKVHKLSIADLKAKKLDSLTFRPVCDSEGT